MSDEKVAQSSNQPAGAPQLGWNQMALGVELLMQKNLVAPALTLIYSMIDSMAWAARPQDHPDVTGADFIAWVDQYMLPSRGIKCTAGELYAARCAILHSLATESRHVRNGKARAILYAWGTADTTKLERGIKLTGKSAVALHIGDLVFGLSEGSRRFWRAADSDPKLDAIIRPRFNQWITSIPDLPV
jgi:hypothetical protein